MGGVALELSTCCQLKVFLPASERKGKVLQNTLYNELSALARLTCYESLLIGAEKKSLLSTITGVRIKQVEFRENVWIFLKNCVRNNEVSVLIGCP